MKVLATQLLEMSQPQTDDRTPWWPLPAPTGQSSRTTTSWLWCMWGSHSMWTYLQNSTLEINDKYARASLFAWQKHGTGNEELQPVWPPNNGLQPEPIQSLGAGFPLQEHFLSNTHMHMFTQTKAFPALCSGWAIIVCLVQLHLKWQRPRAMGGGGLETAFSPIHDIAAAREAAQPCLSLLLPLILLFPCSCQPEEKKKNPLFPPVLHKDSMIPHLLLSLVPSAYSDPPPANRLCLSLSREIIFLPCLEGSKLTVDESGQKPMLWSLSFACSAKDRQWYLYRPAASVPCSPNAYLQQRKKRICVHVRTYRQAPSVCRLN